MSHFRKFPQSTSKNYIISHAKKQRENGKNACWGQRGGFSLLAPNNGSLHGSLSMFSAKMAQEVSKSRSGSFVAPYALLLPLVLYLVVCALLPCAYLGSLCLSLPQCIRSLLLDSLSFQCLCFLPMRPFVFSIAQFLVFRGLRCLERPPPYAPPCH